MATMPANYYVGTGANTRLATQSDYDAILKQRAANDRNKGLIKLGTLATAGLVSGGAAGAFGGSGAVAGGVPTSGGMVAPAAGKFSMGNLLRLGELGAGLFGNIFGQRSQNRAQQQAQQMQAQQFAEQMALARETESTRKAEADRLAQEQRAQWDATQKMEGDRWAASEEERLYARGLRDKEQRLLDEREARRAPRRALSQQALMRISELLNARRG